MDGQQVVNSSPKITRLYSGETILKFDDYEKTVEGSTYYNEEWNDIAVLFRNGKNISNYKGRYDLINQSIEVNVDGHNYKFPINIIQEFTMDRYSAGGILLRHRFINPTSSDSWGSKSLFFLELITEKDTLGIYKSTQAEYYASNYNEELAIGTKNAKIGTAVHFYFYDAHSFERIPKKRKQAILFFEETAPEIAKNIVQLKLNPKSEKDWRKIFLSQKK